MVNELLLLRMVIVRVCNVAVGGKRKIVAIREEEMLRIEKKKKKKKVHGLSVLSGKDRIV